MGRKDKDAGRFEGKETAQVNQGANRKRERLDRKRKNDVFSGTNNVTLAESWACRGMMMMMMMMMRMRRNLGLLPALS